MEDRIGARVAASHHIIAPRSPRAVLHPCIPALYHRQPRRIEEERSKNSGPHRTVVNSTRASVEGNIYEGKLRRRLAGSRDYTKTLVVVGSASTRKHSRKHFSRHVPSIRVCTSRITVHLNGSISSCGWYSNIHERRIAR